VTEPRTTSTPNSSAHGGALVANTRTFFTPSPTSSLTRCVPRKPVPPVTRVTGGFVFASAALFVAAPAFEAFDADLVLLCFVVAIRTGVGC
jgi:hypothetical protein